MQVEEELRRILLNLLRIGLLRIRAFAWDGLAEYCALEADHLHNLPDIAFEVRTELLLHYYDIERPGFVKRAMNPEQFQPDWKRLGEILAELRSKDRAAGGPGPYS
jgi:hypothetical protein